MDRVPLSKNNNLTVMFRTMLRVAIFATILLFPSCMDNHNLSNETREVSSILKE